MALKEAYVKLLPNAELVVIPDPPTPCRWRSRRRLTPCWRHSLPNIVKCGSKTALRRFAITTPMIESAPTGAELLNTLEAALRGSPADQTEIVLLLDRTAVTRYANSEIHQNVLQADTPAAVRVAVGGATARVFTNAADVAGLRRAVEEATALARRSARNPRFTSLPGPDCRRCRWTRRPRPPSSRPPPRSPRRHGPPRWAGLLTPPPPRATRVRHLPQSPITELAVANSLGIRAYAPATTAYLKALVDSGQGTGYADALDRDVAHIDPEAIAREAVAKCRANHDPDRIAAGRVRRRCSSRTRWPIWCASRCSTAWGRAATRMGSRS